LSIKILLKAALRRQAITIKHFGLSYHHEGRVIDLVQFRVQALASLFANTLKVEL
jgi:hypothetical protein